ncbi:MAPEG family protein [Parasphingorhabdus sp.]|uniref:MAPEG family protein n=1 Tax=Parasphingorhabdus sp. TaxID=2709688 RepID=UPI003265F98D
MVYPLTTAMAGAFLIILQQFLMMNAGSHRARAKIGVGYSEDQDLERKVRRHGNLAENGALFLVILALVEGFSGGGTTVTIFAAVFVIARISHAIGFSSLSGSHADGSAFTPFVLFRMFGAMGTGLTGIALGLYLTYLLATL